MTQQEIWMIVLVIGILVLGPLYGYFMGKIGMRHSWTFRKIRLIAAGPLIALAFTTLAANIVYKVFYEGPGSGSVWTKFPWTALTLAAMLAIFASAKGAGVPLDEFRNRGGKISDRKKSDLSIT